MLFRGDLRPPAQHRKHEWCIRHRESGPIGDWNNDPRGGAWTGYDDVIDGMRKRISMVDRAVVMPSTPWQYARYHLMQITAIALGYARRPPGTPTPAMQHVFFEDTWPPPTYPRA